MTIALISRDEAIAQSLKRYFTGIPCKHGHVSERQVSSKACVECGLVSSRKHKSSDKWKKSFTARGKRQKESGTYTEANRKRLYKHKYGIEYSAFEQMLEVQQNCCAICKFQFDRSSRMTSPCVDHNHTTNDVRGLLCFSCNKALGHFKESIDAMKNAINYLEVYGGLPCQ